MDKTLDGMFLPICVSFATVAVLTLGLYRCDQMRRDEYRRGCELRGGTVIEAMTPNGERAMICRGRDGRGGVIAVPDASRVFLPRHQ